MRRIVRMTLMQPVDGGALKREMAISMSAGGSVERDLNASGKLPSRRSCNSSRGATGPISRARASRCGS
jgi:hypothetical protein